MSFLSDAEEDIETYAHNKSKRRRVRKGTHSCWECRRRKMKCIMDPLSNDICKACRRRGSKCISQEYQEDGSHDLSSKDIAETRIPGSHRTQRAPTDGLLTPTSVRVEVSPQPAFSENLAKHQQHSLGKHERLSQFLHQSLPSFETMKKICNASRPPFVSLLSHEILTIPNTVLENKGLRTPESLLDLPEMNTHPVLMARYMLQLAIFLQHVHPELHADMKDLLESPRAIRERMADLAIKHVTTNDELLGSIEGLECIMLEGMYQANIGNLRRSWVTGRRAIGIAQLMGLDRQDHRTQYKILDPTTDHYPQFMWFRCIFLDRHLSLILGLPLGPLDCGMASDTMRAQDTPTGRIERVHCALALQILQRNESSRASEHLSSTQSIDLELQKIARSLPSKWWLAPSLDSVSPAESTNLFWEIRRLFAQLLHYNLINQLHLPYMLCSSTVTQQRCEYSRFQCVNASREIISRSVTLRCFNRIAYSWACRIVDFLALMAAMTLLLAHLDSHYSDDVQNLLAHQYLTDRAMIEQVQSHMEEVNRIYPDPLSAQGADLLRRLLAIDLELENGPSSWGKRVSVHETRGQEGLQNVGDESVVSVHIPYFGIIKIAREGVRREISRPQAPTTDTSSMGDTVELTGNVLSAPTMEANSTSSTDATPQFPMDLSNPMLQVDEFPDLAAVGSNWAFQGVDLAFFDSLMRGAGDDGLEESLGLVSDGAGASNVPSA